MIEQISKQLRKPFWDVLARFRNKYNFFFFSKVDLGLYSKLSKHDFGFLKFELGIN